MTHKTAAILLVLTGIPLVVASGQKQTSKSNYTVYEVRADVRPPRPVSDAVPPPPESVDKNLKVRVSFVVAPDGTVADIRLLNHSRSDFDQYAIETVSKWKFVPGEKDGKPVAVRLETELRSHK